MKLFLSFSPRSVAIVSNKNALLIQDLTGFTSNSNEDESSPKKCAVEFVESNKIDFSKYIDISTVYNINYLGLLGLVSINDYTFLIVITKTNEVGSPRPRERIYSIEDVEFICLNSDDFDGLFTKKVREEAKKKEESYDVSHQYPYHNLKKTIIKGRFYSATTFDLTNNLQNRDINGEYLNLNRKFLWNKLLIEEFVDFRNRLSASERVKFDECRFLSYSIRGFVQTLNCSVNLDLKNGNESESSDCLVTLISRIAIDRSGKILGPCGLDDEGHVGNYIESEMIFYNESYCISYTIIRGNVPIYFEIDNQQSSSLLKKIQINRPFEATQQSFQKHFEQLIKTFGEIHVVNAISSAISLVDIESPTSKKSKGIEFDMFKAYYDHFLNLPEEFKDMIKISNFNYPLSNLRNQTTASQVVYNLEEPIFRFAAFCLDHGNNQLNKQSGAFRVGSFDIKDKCNEVQKIISRQVLLYALSDSYSYLVGTTGPNEEAHYDTIFASENNDLWLKLSHLWDNNNITLNKILSKYNTELKQINKKGNIINNNLDLTYELINTLPEELDEKKKGLINTFTDLTLSTSKKLFNLSNYKDLLNDLEKRNNAIFVILGKDNIDISGNVVRKVDLYDPINDYIDAELSKVSNTYLSEKQISIFAGTFNVNGTCYEGDLDTWLFPKQNEGLKEFKRENAEHPNDISAESSRANSKEHSRAVSRESQEPEVDQEVDNVVNGSKLSIDEVPDIFFIGLQEIVELTAGQMMNVDLYNKNFWERKLLQEINNKIKGPDKIILLWSANLGGLLSLLFIKSTHVPFVKQIEESMKKTGLGGMAANKGGIAVSLQYSNTSLCFVSSHLAAGLNNVEERRQNYKSLNAGLRFLGNKTIKSHDVIIWLGDFNFRIDRDNDFVRSKIKEKQLSDLLEYDQLNQKMRSGVVFPFYEEFDITFKPTYKFNHNEDTYDLSEKMRIPAWCDRILHRSKQVKQLTYGASFDINFSDHRPVFGLFLVKVVVIDEDAKNDLVNELYATRKRQIGDLNSVILSGKLFLQKSDFFPEEIHELPPPSNDNNKWWFKHGMLARVELFKNIKNIKEFDMKSEEEKIEWLKEEKLVNPHGEFIYDLGMIVNEKRPKNPFEFTNEPDFVSAQKQ